MSARDRKLIMILAPLASFAVYWMLLLNPALDRKAGLEAPLAKAQIERDAAVQHAEELQSAKERYDADYREMVKLARAIPQSVRVSDLMRELAASAEGTGIEFNNITMGSSNPDGAQEAAAQASEQTVALNGLEVVPVQLTFTGDFFGLSGLFHRVQRFVTEANGDLQVRGRLLRIESLSLQSGSFPNITATIEAAVYVAAAGNDPAARATAVGPPGAERGDGGLKPVDNFTTAAVAP